MAENEKNSSVLSQIIVAVVIALIAGGTSPWWWEKLFPPKQPANTRNISGTWTGGTGIYQVTQEGNQVVWDGIGRFGNRVWHHKATGTINGDTIYATMEELPDSNYPAIPGGARTDGTISSDGKTITWVGQNDQERVWLRK